MSMPKPETPPEIAAYFAAFTARRKKVERACEQCGTAMGQVETKRRYCTDACRMRAMRKRQRAQGAAGERDAEPPT